MYGHITPSRGIRQGDSLSPFLFVLCARGLSSLLTASQENNRFKGIKIANLSPTLSHLFFADDSLVFFRATTRDCQQVKHCIDSYAKASGQLINSKNQAYPLAEIQDKISWITSKQRSPFR